MTIIIPLLCGALSALVIVVMAAAVLGGRTDDMMDRYLEDYNGKNGNS